MNERVQGWIGAGVIIVMLVGLVLWIGVSLVGGDDDECLQYRADFDNYECVEYESDIEP